MFGSSPRARGTEEPFRRRDRQERFIPARAGNGRQSSSRHPCTSVHPRARGERRSRRSRRVGHPGSSPRARGTEATPARRGQGHRFIPARAGNGLPFVVGASAASGSSPRARGTVSLGERHQDTRRFIPARAGNGGHLRRPSVHPPVHPRARGERRPCVFEHRSCNGSSPRARGTGGGPRSGAGQDRFIPARAGNGLRGDPSDRSVAVHPRARGERAIVALALSQHLGSSPRARGTACNTLDFCGCPRFIPARAGNGVVPAFAMCLPSVHPRARGERPVSARRPSGGTGSSPRARGTDRQWEGATAYGRFIPARAGNGRLRANHPGAIAVHPRARGERVDGLASNCKSKRFIPARAGNGPSCRGVRITSAVHPRARGERPSPFLSRHRGDGSSPRARGTGNISSAL